MNPDISLINNYAESLQSRVVDLIKNNSLSDYIRHKYPESHNITSNKLLYDYVLTIKKRHMKKAPPIHKITFDDKIDRVYSALGLHSTISRTQGNRLKAKSEIKIASLFKKAPEELLYMISVHELAHLKVKQHNKDFYRLCCYMEPDYHQLEFDLRLYLISLELDD